MLRTLACFALLVVACDPGPAAPPRERPIGPVSDNNLQNAGDEEDEEEEEGPQNTLPPGVIGIGSCDGVNPADDENSDCDGYCRGIEGGYVPCNDGSPPGTGVPGRNPVPPPREPSCIDTSFDVSATEIIPPRILLVVDKSGSMNDDAAGFGARKWDAARAALRDVVNQATAEFGLMLYPNGTAQANVCAHGVVQVPVASSTSTSIVSTLNATSPGGGTPTAVTLVEARRAMDALGADGGTRAIVLATDGGPNCNSTLNGQTCRCVSPNPGDCRNFAENCLDDQNAIAAAAQVAAAGYPLFVIGIPGAENFSDVLNAMAQAGGTNEVFNATSGNALAQRINAITQSLASCRYTLQQSVAGASTVTVTVDGVPIGEDPQNGYTLSGDALELHGGACQQVQAGAQAGVTIGLRICDG